jgi:hypothetical protein
MKDLKPIKSRVNQGLTLQNGSFLQSSKINGPCMGSFERTAQVHFPDLLQLSPVTPDIALHWTWDLPLELVVSEVISNTMGNASRDLVIGEAVW